MGYKRRITKLTTFQDLSCVALDAASWMTEFRFSKVSMIGWPTGNISFHGLAGVLVVRYGRVVDGLPNCCSCVMSNVFGTGKRGLVSCQQILVISTLHDMHQRMANIFHELKILGNED